MKTPPFPSKWILAALGVVLLASGVSVAQEKPTSPPGLLDADGVAFIDAKNKAEALIRKAERKRAKLIFTEANAKAVVLAYAIPQPKPAEIETFMAPLKNFIATTKSGESLRWANEQIVALNRRYGFEKGNLRAVYIFIPVDKEEPLRRVSFAAETQAEAEKFIREDLKPVKLEIGKPYQAREGVRASVWEISHGWDGEELVKDQDLEDMLENWVNWHRKRGLLK